MLELCFLQIKQGYVKNEKLAFLASSNYLTHATHCKVAVEGEFAEFLLKPPQCIIVYRASRHRTSAVYYLHLKGV